jgi:molybdate transport system ATP-binding protein
MENVTVRYGETVVLDHVHWNIRSGEHWALIGPNGAGKTTLLKLITGDQLQGYANRITLFGRTKGCGETVWEIKQQIGYVSDELHARYQKNFNTRDVVASGFFDSVGLYRRCSQTQQQRVACWLNLLNLEALAEARFDRLSYGQQRLILVARAMIKAPPLLILDEPCNGLDTEHRRKVLDLAETLGRTHKTQLIFVTHRKDELPACITHCLYLEAGRVKDRVKV